MSKLVITEVELSQIVHDVAAIVLSTPSIYPESGEPSKPKLHLLERNLQEYVREYFTEVL